MLWMLLSFVMALLIGILNFFTGDKAETGEQTPSASGGWPFTGKGAKTVAPGIDSQASISTTDSKKID